MVKDVAGENATELPGLGRRRTKFNETQRMPAMMTRRQTKSLRRFRFAQWKDELVRIGDSESHRWQKAHIELDVTVKTAKHKANRLIKGRSVRPYPDFEIRNTSPAHSAHLPPQAQLDQNSDYVGSDGDAGPAEHPLPLSSGR